MRECCLLQFLILATAFSIVTTHSIVDQENTSAKISQICTFVMKANCYWDWHGLKILQTSHPWGRQASEPREGWSILRRLPAISVDVVSSIAFILFTLWIPFIGQSQRALQILMNPHSIHMERYLHFTDGENETERR